MNNAQSTMLVAQRELLTRTRTNAFRIITAVLALAAIVGPIVASQWPTDSDKGREVTVGIAGPVDAALVHQIQLVGEGELLVDVSPLGDASAEAIDDALAAGDIDVAIESSNRLAWNEKIDHELEAVLTQAMQQRAAVTTAETVGLTSEQTRQLFTPAEIDQRFVDETDLSDELRLGVAFLGLMMGSMLPVFAGSLALASVVEEKSTRVVEVLLGHIHPRTLLLGKVLGLTVLFVTQVMIIVTGLATGLLVTDAVEIPRSVWQFVPVLLVSLVGGLLVYNTIFALVGSLISRHEDTAQVVLPITAPLVAAFVVGSNAANGNAETALAKALTYVPLTTPMLLPVRVALDAIDPWEVVLALLILTSSVWLFIRAAGRIYEFSLLQTGSRIGWERAWALARGADRAS